jgi:hypothetical protein
MLVTIQNKTYISYFVKKRDNSQNVNFIGEAKTTEFYENLFFIANELF